ncbi:unnamed protein product [Darwinula stevensoni]|uniref:Microsomal glutathione S-transferase 1 n=1 Tax=Darwinula stevensoni TaxID=69355 RepID=A0A7R8XD87_9CRUS|nr:unnamed protein product [Darwinula stevensoni]CAG0893253.1 unnamed protein product [Darwinula stevensoni]
MGLHIPSHDDPILAAYVFYATVLCLKVLLMGPLTGKARFSKKAFANPEDVKFGGKVKLDDPDVERVRRAHLNDLENIPIFVFVAGFYVLTQPSLFVATWVFRIFTISRVIHTFVYVIVPMQPARDISFFVALFSTVFMIFKAFANPEDVKFGGKVTLNDPDVERVRRIAPANLKLHFPEVVKNADSRVLKV